MSRKLLTSLAVLAALLTGGPALAAERSGAALALDVAVQMFQLRTETSMIVYDETTDVYKKQAAIVLAAAAPSVEASIKDLTAKDAAAGAAVKENWRVIRRSLAGGDEFGPGIFSIGYDAATHGYFDDNAQKMHETLDKTYALSAAEAKVEARAYLLAARTVATYIQASASPFGSYTNSFNTEDSDLTVLVTRLDSAVADLNKKYRSDKEKGEKAKRINAKWQFIRTTILKVGKQSTPMIVYKHGGDIVRELKTFN